MGLAENLAIIVALASLALAQIDVPASIQSVLLTAIPPASLPALVDPSGAASLRSDFAAGNTPNWYSALPANVKTYLATATPAETTTSSRILTSVTLGSVPPRPTSSPQATSTLTTPDSKSSFSSPSSPSSSSSTSSTTSSSVSISSSTSASGLSAASKVGIGVGIGLGIPLLAVVAGVIIFLFTRERRKRKRLEAALGQHGSNTLGNDMKGPQDWTSGGGVGSTHHQATTPQTTRPQEPVELGPGRQRAELKS